MRFEDERYVRVYTRDTTTWKLLSWNARCVLQALFRKVDRAGLMDLEADPAESVAAMVDAPIDVVEEALPQLLKRGCVEIREGVLVLPRFLEAQECKQSDPARKRAQRERDRAIALDSTESRHVTDGHATGQPVTPRDQESHAVTLGHTESQPVTPYRTDPVPSRTEREGTPEPAIVGPRPFEGITESVKAACVMAGAPMPTQAHVIAYENHREEKTKAKTEQGFVSWMIREKSFARSSNGSGSNGRSDPPLTSAAYRPLKVS